MRSSAVRSRRFVNWLVLLLVNLLWAGQFPAYKMVSEHMSVISLNFWTFAIAIGILFPFLVVSRQKLPTRARLNPNS